MKEIDVITLSASQNHILCIKLEPPDKFQSLMWDARGKGLFVNSYDDSGPVQMVTQGHVDLDGQFATLRQQIGGVGGWMIPLRDGKRIAYHVSDVDRNIWMLQRI